MKSGRELLRYWVTFDERVGRLDYLVHGLGLTATKYAIDVAMVAYATGAFWTPWSYLTSAPVLLAARFADAPGWLAPTLVAWTLPFLWIGVTMTMRRALDAGQSAWLALLFFVPLVSYGMIAVLCALPESRRPPLDPRDRTRWPDPRLLPSALLSMAVGAALGLGMLLFSVRYLDRYGLALFMGTPFVVGAVTAFLLCQRYPASRKEVFEVVAMTSLLIAGAAFALGTEGVICLVMLAPMGVVVALMGGVVGAWIADHQPGSVGGAGLALIFLPVVSALEEAPPVESVREVVTAIEIDAPPETVWTNVVAFTPLDEPDELLFRLGVAYPTHAEIRGEGVGAVRYCVFSTGAFVEPITAWEPGRRLAFDVVESPAPLRELTPYEIAPPHLEGYLAPRRGEFRLVPLPGGRTRLEGTTWYEQRLEPEGYWALYSDRIIRKIHLRVLEHIEALSEGTGP
jgi:uncharacterized membrane protein YhaH (DUF805 family)